MRLHFFYRSLIVLLFSIFAQNILAQTAIQGIVMDKKYKEPLTGAAILIEGTTNGTTADIDGNYTLNVNPGKYTLIISYVSYKTQKIADVIVEKGKTTTVNIDCVVQCFFFFF